MKRKDGKKKARPALPRLTVNVTKEDIDLAKPGNSSHCMIGRAVARAVGVNERFVSVDIQLIEFSDPKRHLRVAYLTPKVAQTALLDYDQEREVQPFTLMLKNPVQVRPSRLGLPKDSPKRQLSPSDVKRQEARESKRRELEAKEEQETLTSVEKGQLTRMRRTDKEGGLAGEVKAEPKRVISGTRDRNTRVEGGNRPLIPTDRRLLSNRRGQRRRYGLRQAD